MRNISRSGYEASTNCPRKYYYTYLWDSSGVVGKHPDLNLTMGIALHKGMERLMEKRGIEEAVEASKREFEENVKEGREAAIKEDNALLLSQIEEAQPLVEALLRGWFRVRFEDFHKRYEVLAIEKEMPILLAPNVRLQARADAVVRDRLTQNLIVFNWKTTAVGDGWTAEWQDDIQSWTEAFAVEEALGEPVVGCIFEGFYKTPRRGGLHTSPLTHGWRNKHNGTWTSTKPTGKGAILDWDRKPVWNEEFPSSRGIKGWIEWMDPSTLSSFFLRSEVVAKNSQVVEEWLDQLVRRETDAQYVLENGTKEEHLTYFWQKFSKWNCPKCTFRPVCRQVTTIESLLAAGQLVRRKDHHEESKEGAVSGMQHQEEGLEVNGSSGASLNIVPHLLPTDGE